MKVHQAMEKEATKVSATRHGMVRLSVVIENSCFQVPHPPSVIMQNNQYLMCRLADKGRPFPQSSYVEIYCRADAWAVPVLAH